MSVSDAAATRQCHDKYLFRLLELEHVEWTSSRPDENLDHSHTVQLAVTVILSGGVCSHVVSRVPQCAGLSMCEWGDLRGTGIEFIFAYSGLWTHATNHQTQIPTSSCC